MKYDIVIIGGGMAGLVSSIYLSEKGFKTAVVSKGDPVCAISSGCIDLMRSDGNPLENIATLPEGHPYKRAGREKVETSFEYFKKIMGEAGLPYYGELDKNRSIFSPIAKRRETSLVPLSMKEADVKNGESLRIISFEGIKDFFPGYFTDKFSNSKCSIYSDACKTTIAIANQFDNREFRERFLSWLEKLNISEDVIAIPAILGTKNPDYIMSEIESRTGKKIFEIPTLPPSIPGIRLFRALKNHAVKLGADLFWGEGVSGYNREENKLSSLIIDKPGRPTIVEGKSFILSTGSFVSGGLYAEKTELKETVFNLPVSTADGEDRLNDDFFKPGHPIGKAGIRIFDNYKPKDSKLENLFIAGSIIENSQIMKYNCGHGLALVTGLEAAAHCEEYLK